MADDEKSKKKIDGYFEEDHPGEISTNDVERGKGIVKKNDGILRHPATTSNLPMDDVVAKPDDEGCPLGEAAQRIIDDDNAAKKDS